jgi:hypothetical protein
MVRARVPPEAPLTSPSSSRTTSRPGAAVTLSSASDGARSIAVSTDPRGTTLVPRSSRVVRPSPTSRQETSTRCPSGGVPRARRPKTTWPKAACRSPTDTPHHRWSSCPGAPLQAGRNPPSEDPRTTRSDTLRRRGVSFREWVLLGVRAPDPGLPSTEADFRPGVFHHLAVQSRSSSPPHSLLPPGEPFVRRS